jgi:hypothetical protein
VGDILPATRRNQEIIYGGIAANSAPMSPADRAIIRAGGSERAEQGITLEDLLHAWRIGLDVLRRRAHEHAARCGYSPVALLGLLELAISWVDTGMEAAASGHREADLKMMRQQDDQRLNSCAASSPGGCRRRSCAERTKPTRSIPPGRTAQSARARQHGRTRLASSVF